MLNTNGLDKIIFFVKLFVVFLYSTKNNFFPIQDCSSEEIFVSLRQACSILYTRINLVDLGQCIDKNDCNHSFKTQLEINLDYKSD